MTLPEQMDCQRQAALRAQLLALRRAGDALGDPGGEIPHREALMARLAEVDRVDAANSTERRKLLALHKEEINTLIAARHMELGWVAHDDGNYTGNLPVACDSGAHALCRWL